MFNRIFLAVLILTLIPSILSAQTTGFLEAWQHVQKYNPSLLAECWNIHASAGKLEQASLLPNPTMDLTTENIGAKNQNDEETQTTLTINQAIPTGDKYYNRVRFKNSEYQLQQRAYSLAYVTLYAEAGQKYVDVLIAQHLYQTLKESSRLSRLTVSTINKRNRAGKSSLLELNSAKIAANETEIQLQAAATELKIARAQLAALWGGSYDEVGMIQDIGLTHKLLPLTTLMSYVCHSPVIQQAFAQTKSGYNAVLANQSDAWPDVNVGLGLRHFQHTNDNALVAGVSVPLPLFDRNQGNVHSSYANYSEKLASQKTALISVKKQIYILYQKASQAQLEMKILNTQLIPTASSAFELAKEGYTQGRFSYLELLNAQQKLIDERARYWQVHGVYDRTLIEMYAMLGIINT